MTDLEITRLCAAAMGYTAMPPSSPADIVLFVKIKKHSMLPECAERYDPLHDDAQAMALVKKIGMAIYLGDTGWWADMPELAERVFNSDLNRAICECVAKMQQVKK